MRVVVLPEVSLMNRLLVVIGMLALSAALLVDSGYSQDKKDEKKDAQPVPGGKVQLFPNWSKIGLTPDQKKKVLAVRATYSVKVEALQKEIKMLKDEEYAESYKLLNDDNKAALRKIADKGGDAGKDKDKDKDAKKGDAKKD